MYAQLSSAALGLVVLVVLGALFGNWLDPYFGGTGLVTVITIMVASLGGVMHLINTIKKVTLDKKKKVSEKPDA